MRFLDELKRRRVFRAAAVYAIVAWLVIQVSDTVMPRLGLPDWAVTLVIVIVGLGFPIALALSWLFDLTPDGIERAPASSPSRTVGLIGLGMIMSLVLFGAYFGMRPHIAHDDAADANSVVVLPFADMSAAHDQQYLGDGITEEILNALAQVPGLRVPARTTSFSFKGKDLSAGEIAQQVGVMHVLEGSVRKQGDQLRITAQLIDARSDKHLWSQTYDRKIDDAFAMQDEIAKSIVDELKLHIGEAQLLERETPSGRAHESYLKGLYYWNRRRGDELPIALDQFSAATRLDPNYARAWAGMALTYAVLPQYSSFDPHEASRLGKEAAARALKLDPKAADAHAALSQIAQELDWDWQGAEQHARQAVELDPNYATAHQWHAETLIILRRYDDALAEANRAIELDPLSSVVQNVRGFSLMQAGRVNEAMEIFQGIIRRDPQFPTVRINAVEAAVILGRFDDAIKIARDSASHFILRALQEPSTKPLALRRLGSPEVRARLTMGDVVYGYVFLDQPDSALALLDRGVDHWAPYMGFMVSDPLLRRSKDNPRYQQLARKLKYPD